MTLEEIIKSWEKDCIIDRTELGDESIGIAKLHFKYHRFLSNERMILLKLQSQLKELKLTKQIFYTEGPSKEQIDAGWELPPRGKILKAEVKDYLEGDKDIIALSLKIGLQQEKVELLLSIMNHLDKRGYQIKTAVDWIKFVGGPG